jgi:hypothetical protein
MIGTTISHCDILEKLGLGVLSRVHDKELERPVDVKFLRPDLDQVDESEQRFIHEARAASSLQHTIVLSPMSKGGSMKQHFAISVSVAMLFIAIFVPSLLAQTVPPENPSVLKLRHLGQAELSSEPAFTSSAPRGYAHYTAKDWRRLIDSTWGPGLPTDQKLQIFDGFWDNFNQNFGGFPNLSYSWDSLKNVFRPEIAAGVSRGRFSSIMSQLSLSLRETSSYISDLGIDSAMLVAGKWRPRGIPFVNLGPTCPSGLGATLTPLPDNSLLVIRVDPNQPLGLQAGDIVLGYDGVPWEQLIRQLLEAQLPISSRYYGDSYWTSSPESWSHILLTSAAVNWHLFDTLDVVKYSTGQTVHLPTWKLDVTGWDNLIAFEQIPVKGVQFPVYPSLPAEIRQCTWGIVEGTNVGYIYIQTWDQYSANFAATAIKELTQQRKTDGLIIDLRFHTGGDVSYLSVLDPLFSIDPSSSFSIATRMGPDRMSFFMTPENFGIALKHQIYDRPIAVLTGPKCNSAGEYSAFLLRTHPMARFFGKPTNTLYVGGNWVYGNYIGNLWYYQVAKDAGYSHYPGEGYLVHKGFDVDERVWFEKDDVAKGDDTVVKRALQWIAELAHGHDVTLAKNSGKASKDMIKVTATVENPQNHTLSVWSYLTNRGGVTTDSCQMFDDGLHYDGIAGDRIYGCSFRPPTEENVYDVSLRTSDITGGTSRKIPRANAYFTNGPVVTKGWRSSTSDTIPNPGDVLRLRFPLVNNGTKDTVRSVTATVSALDTMVFLGTTVQISYGDMAPGVESVGSTTQPMRIQSYCPPNTKARLLLSIVSEGLPVWTDTVTVLVQSAATEVTYQGIVPAEYSLSQNYPNPFNPATNFELRIANLGLVTLKIFDALGREVATLVNESKAPGVYRLTWDAATLPSGIYFYRMTTRSFTETKKLMLLR